MPSSIPGAPNRNFRFIALQGFGEIGRAADAKIIIVAILFAEYRWNGNKRSDHHCNGAEQYKRRTLEKAHSL